MDSGNDLGMTEDELMEMLSWLKPLPELTKEQLAMGYSRTRPESSGARKQSDGMQNSLENTDMSQRLDG